MILPESGVSDPVKIFRMVVFPVPFFAINATFWSLWMLNERCSKRDSSPKDFDISSTFK